MTFDLSSTRPPGPVHTDDRRLLRNDVYDDLLQAILTGVLAPGSRLKDAELTARLGVSRTPVREALGRLATVGLVRASPNRFTVVAPLDAAEIAGAAAVLRLLYPAGLRAFAELAGPDAELELTLLHGRLDRDAGGSPLDHFRRVMRVVLASAGNPVLAEAVEAVQPRLVRALHLFPGAGTALDRRRALTLTRALIERDGEAVDVLSAVLDDVVECVSARADASG